jgi:hypothetical protein
MYDIHVKISSILSDKPGKKYYIITNDNKKLYIGAAGNSLVCLILPFIRMNNGDKEILIDTRKMKIGQNLALIHLVGGPINSCGVIQQRKKHTTILKRICKNGCDIV